MKSIKKKFRLPHFISILVIIIFSFSFIFSNHTFAQEATGGDEVYEIEIGGKTYRVHAFKTVGNHTFVVNQDLEVDVLIVGGGAAGRRAALSSTSGPGGGAGGVLFKQNLNYTNSVINLYVGSGGVSPTYNTSVQGSGTNSFFDSHIAYGGGGGGMYGSNVGVGYDGGSGGGGRGDINGNRNGGNGVTEQGNAGSASSGRDSGAGGGAGASAISFNGGEGRYFGNLFGDNLGENGWFGGGGGAGYHTNSGLGGIGGGGDGGKSNIGENGLPNSGGGGGGGSVSGLYGGDGGSGIVIVRYEISSFSLNISNDDADITPTKSSPNFNIIGTIDYPEDGDATSVEVSASLGGISRSINVPVSENMTWQLSWNYNDLTEGEYSSIEFTATSNSTTPEETNSIYTGKIIIDKTSPTCGSWSPAESPWKVSGGETFTLTSSTDAGGSGLATASASLSCSTGPLHGDTCPVTIFDKTGNDQICPSPINRVDIFAPNLTVTPAITGWQGDKQDIIVLSEDNETSLSRIAYAWDLNTLGSDCSGGTSISSGDNLRLTISGGANPLYVCSIDIAGNVSTFTNIYQYIPPVFSNPKVDKNVKPSNLYWNIQSISETQSYIEVKGFFPKTTGSYNYALEYIISTINKSFTQALRTSPFTETHFTFLIPTTDFRASKDNHTFSGPQKLKITDLDQMEATTIDHNLSFFFPIHQTNHRTSFNYYIFASDNRLNKVGE